MNKLKEIYQRVVCYTVTYHEFVLWIVMFTVVLGLLLGGMK